MIIKYDKTINADNMRQKDFNSLLKVFTILEHADSVPDEIETFTDSKNSPIAYRIYTSTEQQDKIKYYIDDTIEDIPNGIQITQNKKFYDIGTEDKKLIYVYKNKDYIRRLTIENLPNWFIAEIISLIPYHMSELLSEYTAKFHKILYYKDFTDLLKTPNEYTAGEPVRVLKFNKFYSVTVLKQQAKDGVQGYYIIIDDSYNHIKYTIDTGAGYLIREEADFTLETMRLYMYKNTYEGIIEVRIKE